MLLVDTKQVCSNCGASAFGGCDECAVVLCRDCALLIHVPGRTSPVTVPDGEIFSLIHSLNGDEFPGRKDVLFRIIGRLASEPNMLCKTDALRVMGEEEKEAFLDWWTNNKTVPST